MADAAAVFLLENLKTLFDEHAKLITESKTEMESLKKDIIMLSRGVEEMRKKKGSEDEGTKELVHAFGQVVYEVEDEIDTFITRLREKKSSRAPTVFANIWKPSLNLTTSVKNIHDLRYKLQEYMTTNIKSLIQPRTSGGVREVSQVVDVLTYLGDHTEKLDVITIVGKPGIGKTTLARETFSHPTTESEFPIRIWIDVSRELSIKDVFLDMLKHFQPLTDDIQAKAYNELAPLVANYLSKKKFLIVADDVWATEDWHKIRNALPKFDKMVGKVLITSCNEDVGARVLKVNSLSKEESWSLLQSLVFGDEKCPSELESVGRLITNQCDGLPLVVSAMARTLLEEDLSSSNMRERRIAWTKVCVRVPQYHASISYNRLPYHLQPCFLYFGIFPYDYKISVSRLIRLWIAEGFIQQEKRKSLEATAETYLRDLINRSLVAIEGFKSNGTSIKTCSLSRPLHEFCKMKAGRERDNFFQEITSSDRVFDPPIDDLSVYRRLSISSNTSKFLSTKPYGPHVRSFIDFSSDKVCLGLENSSALPAAFKLVRVLDVKPLIFTKIPSQMYDLFHLRFLALSLDSEILPSKFSNFWYLKTLIIHTTSPTLEVKADIWLLTRLRHFKTNASATLPIKKSKEKAGPNFQTLTLISPESCTKELLEGARDLKKLGISGSLPSFFDGTKGSFRCFVENQNLEILKLQNDIPSQGPLLSPLPTSEFPPRLKSLTLANTYLDWTEMRTLSYLDRLEVLKLKDYAFKGRKWVTEGGGFQSLKALHIGRSDLAIWVASALHLFPELSSLKISECMELQEVPIELSEIITLERLQLNNSNKLAAASARRIEAAVIEKRYKEEPSINTLEFKLAIYPEIE